MRISDWSSDVCSSDLLRIGLLRLRPHRVIQVRPVEAGDVDRDIAQMQLRHDVAAHARGRGCGEGKHRHIRQLLAETSKLTIFGTEKIGRASCRERVCQYGWI